MITTQKICITFAGAVGSSKTPIANFMSTKLDLPILSNDIIRTEVLEDLGVFNEEEYNKRRDERLRSIIESGVSFIYDASVDREWKALKEALSKNSYRTFVISLDLSKKLLTELYERKGYHESKERLDQLMADHENFIAAHGHEITVRISDEQFADRLKIGYEQSKIFLEQNSG